MNVSSVSGEEQIAKDSRGTFRVNHLRVLPTVGYKDESENAYSMWAESVATRK